MKRRQRWAPPNSQPDAADHPTHREAQQIDLLLTPTSLDMAIQQSGQVPQGNSSQTVRKVGDKPSDPVLIKTLFETAKQPRCVPETVHQHQGSGSVHTVQWR